MALIDQIRADILAGRLAPGSLLSQTVLATTYGVSRIPIRDALHQLAAEKLVMILPGKSARVTALTADELAEIYDLRVTLECDLLARAILNADKSAHAEAEYALRKSSLEAGRPGWQSGDWLFHQVLYTPAKRPRQLAIVAELRSACALYARQYDGLAAQTSKWLSDHDAIFDAYVRGQSALATTLLRAHILAAQSYLEAPNTAP
jgi:DNA-binding GntR family transcriptional regulator